ncbi:MAG: type VI secretion system Vgr family protein, partial [Gemmataceae bacterium]
MEHKLSRAALKNVTLTTPLDDGIKLVSMRGREALSELFSYRIELLVERGKQLDFAALLGADVALALEQKTERGQTQVRRVHGIVRRLGETGGYVEHVAYELEIVPRFWLWTQRVRCRIFQDQTTPEILKQVLDGLEVQFELSHEYRVHTYRTQFRESDYQFACRLMEEEGIYFFFRHESGNQLLVLADNSPASAELAGGPLRFSAESPSVWDAPRVRHWRKFQELRPARITLTDHFFQLPEQDLEASRTETAVVAAGTVQHQPGLGSRLDLEI